jgi:isocitrate dehydrogenase
MMFDYLGWNDVAQKITRAVEMTIAGNIVTYGLTRRMENPKEVKCSEFATAIIDNLDA